MSYQIDIQNALSVDAADKEQEPPPRGIPSEEQLNEWAGTALFAASGPNDAEMTIRLVEEAEIVELNQVYRHKSGSTNVLSFPAELPDEVELPLLGDVIICAQVISVEAEAQNKALYAHWAHMVVHGTLHLLGYDHIDEAEAEEMETKEIEILADIGYPNPYMVMKKI